MSDTLAPLIRDFLEWIGTEPKAYADVMEAWRSSCPRLTVWEDAVERGFVAQKRSGRKLVIGLTPAGRDFLRANS